jgi:hypothetical protein
MEREEKGWVLVEEEEEGEGSYLLEESMMGFQEREWMGVDQSGFRDCDLRNRLRKPVESFSDEPSGTWYISDCLNDRSQGRHTLGSESSIRQLDLPSLHPCGHRPT